VVWRFAGITNLLPYKAILSQDYETELPKKFAMPKAVRKRTFANGAKLSPKER
jgi:hypothetical protein